MDAFASCYGGLSQCWLYDNAWKGERWGEKTHARQANNRKEVIFTPENLGERS